MIPALQLAQICADAYQDTPTGFDHTWEYGGNHAAHRKVDDTDVIVFRGSLDTMDWMSDAAALPVWDYQLGWVHGGFLLGVRDVMVAAALVCGPKVVVTGHSLGGARARLLAGLMAFNNQPLLQCTVFGSPKPAFSNLGRILDKSGVTAHTSFRNRSDPVPLAPISTLLLPYCHTEPWIAVDGPPAADDLMPLRDHGSARYLEGLAKLYPPVTAG